MQFAQFIAQQRAAVAASGVVDTTGSPLALADTKQEQYAADETLYQVESAQRQLYFDADMQRNAGTVAGMQGLGFRAESAGAMGSIGMAEAQARLIIWAQGPEQRRCAVCNGFAHWRHWRCLQRRLQPVPEYSTNPKVKAVY